MFEGISTICFTSSYAVALGLELGRLRSTRTLLRVAVLAAAAAGVVAHTLYLAVRARAASPLSSPCDWYLVAAWLLALLYVLLLIYYPRLSMGLFMLPLVLGLTATAQFADAQPFAPTRASQFWGNLHGSFLLLGTVTVVVGFASAVMYLAQDYRLKRGLLSVRGFRLPSLEWLARINRRSLAVSAFLIGVGFLSGLVLNRITHPGRLLPLPWYDPVVLSSAAMFFWLVGAELVRLTRRAARGGQRAAYLNIATFVFLVIALVMLSFVDTRHGPNESGDQRHSGVPPDCRQVVPVCAVITGLRRTSTLPCLDGRGRVGTPGGAGSGGTR